MEKTFGASLNVFKAFRQLEDVFGRRGQLEVLQVHVGSDCQVHGYGGAHREDVAVSLLAEAAPGTLGSLPEALALQDLLSA